MAIRLTESALRRIVREEITEMAGSADPTPTSSPPSSDYDSAGNFIGQYADNRPRRPRGKGVAAIVRCGHLFGGGGRTVKGAGGHAALQRQREAVASQHGCQARPHRTSEITDLVRLYGPTETALVDCVADMETQGLLDLEGRTPEQAVAEGMAVYRD